VKPPPYCCPYPSPYRTERLREVGWWCWGWGVWREQTCTRSSEVSRGTVKATACRRAPSAARGGRRKVSCTCTRSDEAPRYLRVRGAWDLGVWSFLV